jgi:hypothetical protein
MSGRVVDVAEVSLFGVPLFGEVYLFGGVSCRRSALVARIFAQDVAVRCWSPRCLGFFCPPGLLAGIAHIVVLGSPLFSLTVDSSQRQRVVDVAEVSLYNLMLLPLDSSQRQRVQNCRRSVSV